MTNIIILICAILAGFLVGKHFEKREKYKGQFFADLSKYVSLLKTNVKGRRIEMANFNEDFCKSSSAVFCKFLKDKDPVPFLTKNQKQLVDSFFNSLSATTSSQLLSNLDYYEQLINAENATIANAVRNCFVCVKLGILVGVMVGILLM